MRGWSVMNGGPTNKDDVQKSVALFEDALRIDPALHYATEEVTMSLALHRQGSCSRAPSRPERGMEG